MDRTLIYAGQIPLETDLLSTNKNTMVSIAKLVAGLFGTSTFANGLSCGATGPASLQVVVQPGEVYALANIDDTAYSSIAADTTHQIMKQGILLDALTLSCPAPGTAGQSINYLIQVQMTEVDTTPIALPYYNASNPASAWVGPANSGAQQYTFRQDKAAVTVKAGVAATTGSQVTPAPDANNAGLWVVTVANGQSTITSANIAQYAGAPLQALGGAISNIHNGYYSKNVAGSSNVTLTPQEANYPIINLTGALTGNINLIIPATSNQLIIANNTTGSFTVTVKTPAGTGVAVTQGTANVLYSDGVNVYSGTPNTSVAQASTVSSFKNLTINAIGVSNYNVVITADEVVLENSSNAYITQRAVNKTINANGTVGAPLSIMSARAASTWYYRWLWYTVANGLTATLDTSSTAPTAPTGYSSSDYKALLPGACRTDSSGSTFLLQTKTVDLFTGYIPLSGSNSANLPIMASGVQGSVNTPTWVAVAIASFVPPNARAIFTLCHNNSSTTIVAPNNSYGASNSNTNPPPQVSSAGTGAVSNIITRMLLESTNIYYAGDTANSLVACFGWE